MRNHFFTLLSIFISSCALGQLQVLDEASNPLASGVIVSLGTYTEPAYGEFNWSLYNSGAKPLRIQSCDVVSSSGVTYGNGVENSGFNILEGLVVGDPVYLSAGEKLGIQIRFRESSEGTYRKSLKITYLVVEDSSASKVEAESSTIEIPLQATIDLPDAPVVDEPEGEPIPNYKTELLPDGFPTGDIYYLGDNQFSSQVLGDFELDTGIENRIIHTILGPLVWDWDEATEMVILHTEWWGDLYTHLPDVSDEKKFASGLGFAWPYIKSEITGATYWVNASADTSDPEAAPFYNHRRINGREIGWQRSIGVDLSSAENYYKAAETLVGQMQILLATMVTLQQEFVDLPVSIAAGQGPIDQKFEQVNAQFLAMHEVYTKFVFYYHRCSLAPIWAEREGKSQYEINLAKAFVNQLPNLETTATAVYSNGQEVLYVNCVNIKATKTHQLHVLIAEEAARQAAAAAAGNSSSASGGISLNFNDGRKPSGWTLYNPWSWGPNFVNGKFFTGSDDSARLYRNISGVSSYIEIEAELGVRDDDVALIYLATKGGASIQLNLGGYNGHSVTLRDQDYRNHGAIYLNSGRTSTRVWLRVQGATIDWSVYTSSNSESVRRTSISGIRAKDITQIGIGLSTDGGGYAWADNFKCSYE